jgi:hypothetical protein
MTGPARTWTAIRTISWPPTWHLARDLACASRDSQPREASDIAEMSASFYFTAAYT